MVIPEVPSSNTSMPKQKCEGKNQQIHITSRKNIAMKYLTQQNDTV
jgi:hypothetical protein